MAALGLALLLFLGQAPPDSGYLTVNSNLPGLAVFLEGDFLGRTPIHRHPVAPGSYMVSIAPRDSLDNLYAAARSGSLGRRLSALWTLAGIDAGTHQAEIRSGSVTEVFIDHGAVLAAPARAKWLAGCGVGGLFGLGVIVGALVAHFAF